MLTSKPVEVEVVDSRERVAFRNLPNMGSSSRAFAQVLVPGAGHASSSPDFTAWLPLVHLTASSGIHQRGSHVAFALGLSPSESWASPNFTLATYPHIIFRPSYSQSSNRAFMPRPDIPRVTPKRTLPQGTPNASCSLAFQLIVPPQGSSGKANVSSGRSRRR
jgi:hypothetical protein